MYDLTRAWTIARPDVRATYARQDRFTSPGGSIHRADCTCRQDWLSVVTPRSQACNSKEGGAEDRVIAGTWIMAGAAYRRRGGGFVSTGGTVVSIFAWSAFEAWSVGESTRTAVGIRQFAVGGGSRPDALVTASPREPIVVYCARRNWCRAGRGEVRQR
nr:hypothetical protein CFP56_22496 [Quercus suber]